MSRIKEYCAFLTLFILAGVLDLLIKINFGLWGSYEEQAKESYLYD